MDDRLKQRLIGAIVLVALAVIFIPMILDGGGGKTLSPFGQAIPDKPPALKKLESAEVKPVEAPPVPDMTERQLVDKHAAAIKTETPPVKNTIDVKPVETKKTEIAKTTLATDKKGVKAWVVQVGSFESRKNALALRDKLLKHKYRAFVESITSNGHVNYRVRIGPEVRRSSAEATQKSIQKTLKINGVVMGHP